MSNHVDQFHAAVSVLAGNGRVKQRLRKAYEDHLADIEVDDLPIAVKQEFADIKTLMYRVAPLNGEGPICASVRKMSGREAAECARSIVSLYHEIMQLPDANEVTLPLDPAETDPVPPFLVKSS